MVAVCREGLFPLPNLAATDFKFEQTIMKTGIHPTQYPCIFVDGEHEWTGVTTQQSNEKRDVDGMEYQVVHVDISAFSHPFYTGQKKIVDTAGRVEKFMQRYGNKQKK